MIGRLATTLAVAGAAAALAGDEPGWPQWGGPTRDFRVPPVELVAGWSAAGPPVLWRRQLGEGYSAVAVVDGVLYTQLRRDGHELCVAIDAATGRTLWERGAATPFPDGYSMENGPGPHATPLVVAGRVFTAGATGRLSAYDATTGERLWRRELIDGLGGTLRRNGYASSPLAVDGVVVVPVGGAGRALVAFDQADGEIVWSSGGFDNGASSPLLVEVAGRRQIVAFLAGEVAGFDAADGRLLWSHPHETPYGLNVSTPVAGPDGLLFVSSAYGRGSRGLRVTSGAAGPAVEELWFTTRMRLHFGNAVRLGEVVIGSSGDFGPAPLTALELASGRVLWRHRGLARASLVATGDRLVLVDEEGTVALATVGRDGVAFDARAELLTAPARTAPTLVGTTVYLRDRHELMAIDLAPRAARDAPAGER